MVMLKQSIAQLLAVNLIAINRKKGASAPFFCSIELDIILSPSFRKNARLFLVFLCLASAWVFPFYGGPSRDAMPQIYVLMMCSLSILLLGIAAVHKGLTVAVVFTIVVMLLVPSPYLGGRLAGVAGLVLFWTACHLGSKANKDSEILFIILIAVTASAFINAVEGLLQWFGLAGNLWPWVIETEGRGIAFGAFRQRNLFATFLSIGIITTIWMVHLEKITNHLAWFLVIIFAFAIAASGSRTGFLEVVAIAVFGIVCYRQQKNIVTQLFLGQLPFYFLATWSLPMAAKLHGFEFITGIARTVGIPQDSRIVLWRNTIEMIWERPWAGWGWLEMGYAHYATISEERFSSMLSHAHNIFLQIAVEFGIPVAFAFLIIIFIGIKSGKPWSLLNTNSFDDVKIVASKQISWLIIFVIFGIHSMLELPLWSFGFLFLLGFSVGYISSATNAEYFPEKNCVNFFVKISCIVLIFSALASACQYRKLLYASRFSFGDNSAFRISKISAIDAWIFRGYSEFILVQLTSIESNKFTEKDVLKRLMRFSAEPLIIKKLILNLWKTQEFEEMNFHIKRYCIAFPEDFQKWSMENVKNPEGIYHSSSFRINLDCRK